MLANYYIWTVRLYTNFILHIFIYLTVYYIFFVTLHKTKHLDVSPLIYIISCSFIPAAAAQPAKVRHSL
jgi:tellurite resistance protein TehA-like permease